MGKVDGMDFLNDRLNIFKDLPSDVLDTLMRACTFRETDAGEVLFREGDLLPFLYMVKSGQYALFKLSSAGEKRIIFTLGPGEILNYPEYRLKPASISCHVVQKGMVCLLDQRVLQDAVRREPSLALNIIDLYNLRMRRLYRQLKNASGSVRLDKRIAAKLWKLSKDYPLFHPRGIAIDMKLTTTFLAELIGASRESVSRNCKVLLDRGLVVQEDGYWIVPDRRRLEHYFKS
ncbi:MAG: Crp/Fnr family transcriptional regulator [Firmicutes bacterium]|nr:Crp/Fnr family transcriptional regulator [Bacillota bacterium]